MDMPEFSSLKNHFLIALPSLGDPNFSHTVTYICEHEPAGAMGIIINRPSQLQLIDIMNHMDIEKTSQNAAQQPIYTGGPVEGERGFVLHTRSKMWDSTLNISEEISITTSKDVLEAIALGKGPDKSLIALGYAGWGAGQLESELQENTWLNAPADTSIIFDVPTEQRWTAAAEIMGIDLNLITSTAGHA